MIVSFCWYWSITSDNNSIPACATPSSCSNLPFPQWSVNIVPQDQIDDKPLRFTTPILTLRNEAILATAPVSVSITHYSSQYFLTTNSPMLCSKLTALETKMCGNMMVIASYFKDELQSLKNNHYASNWSMHRSFAPLKSRNQKVSLLLMKLGRYYPFIPQICSRVRQLYPNIECS